MLDPSTATAYATMASKELARLTPLRAYPIHSTITTDPPNGTGGNTSDCRIPLGPPARFLRRFSRLDFDPAVLGSGSLFSSPSDQMC